MNFIKKIICVLFHSKHRIYIMHGIFGICRKCKRFWVTEKYYLEAANEITEHVEKEYEQNKELN